MKTYLDESFAKVYDHVSIDSIVVLEWGIDFVTLEEGKTAVNAVLKTLKKHNKKQLLALINADGFEYTFLDWLVESWYKPAKEAGLLMIAHKMGQHLLAQMSAEQVAEEDISGIRFKSFYTENEEDILDWLLSKS